MKKQLDIKACPKCGFTCARMDVKALEEYFGHRGSILQSWCKVCRRVQTAEKRKGIKVSETTPVKQPALRLVDKMASKKARAKKSDLQKVVDKGWREIAKQVEQEREAVTKYKPEPEPIVLPELPEVQLDIWNDPSSGINRLREIPERLEDLRVLYVDQYPNDKCKVRAFKFMANRLIKRFGGLTKVNMSELTKAKLGLTGKGAK